MDKSVLDFNVRLRTIRIRDLIIGVIVTIIISAILMVIFPEIADSDDLFFITFLSVGLLLFIWALRGTTGFKKNIENIFEDKNIKEILYVVIINILFASVLLFFISLLDYLVTIIDPTWISIWNSESLDVNSNIFIFDAIGTLIFAPVVEELIFRGVLFNRLKIRTGIIASMIISSVLFAIGHDFGGITSAFLFGICMCILYLKSDNILIPITAHFLNNFIAMILEISNIDLYIGQSAFIFPALLLSTLGGIFLIKYIIDEIRIIKQNHNP